MKSLKNHENSSLAEISEEIVSTLEDNWPVLVLILILAIIIKTL